MTTTPHDALFKAVFSQPENAAVALKPLLPEALAEATDWASLTLEPGSYIDEELAERQSDLLFRADIAGPRRASICSSSTKASPTRACHFAFFAI